MKEVRLNGWMDRIWEGDWKVSGVQLYVHITLLFAQATITRGVSSDSEANRTAVVWCTT